MKNAIFWFIRGRVLLELGEGGRDDFGFGEPVFFVFLPKEELLAADGLRSLEIEFNVFDELAKVGS